MENIYNIEQRVVNCDIGETYSNDNPTSCNCFNVSGEKNGFRFLKIAANKIATAHRKQDRVQ